MKTIVIARVNKAEDKPKHRWCLCIFCGTVNKAFNRSKYNPHGVTYCVSCSKDFPTGYSENWIE